MAAKGESLVRELCRRLYAFCTAKDGNVAIIFGIAVIPLVTGVGAAVDYSRANATKVALQAALDSALLAGARDNSATWTTVALNTFNGNLATKVPSLPTPAFSKEGSSIYAGTVTTPVSTTMLGVVGINTVDVTVRGKAIYADADNSCILTLDQGQPASHVALSLNGAPVINLSGCSIRSNTSVDCNGHDGSVTKTIASGTAGDCNKPTSNAPPVPDTYKDLAANITTACPAGQGTGVDWNAGTGTIPTGPNIKPVAKSGYTEYHICGDLRLTGTGTIPSSSPSSDTVIVIENGSVVIDDKANISTLRTSIVLTGDNSYPDSKIKFPNGAGKTGTLSLSPPTSSTNPWQAVALYLDPKLTKYVDNSWGPGAAFMADGLVYLGNSNVVTDGNTSSANSKCTKFVMNSFTTNGAVKLDFAQQNCAALGLKQWDGIFVHLVQ